MVANAIADQTTAEDAPFSFVVPATTFADQDAGDTLTLSASLASGDPLPTWLGFDAATYTFSGAPDDAQVGTLSLSVTATDTGNLSASDTFGLTVTNVNEAPALANPIADQTTVEDSAFSFQVPATTFADPDAGDTLTYSTSQGDGSTLPGWLSFDAASRTFSGTPDDTQVGMLSLTVTATDGGGLRAA